MSSMGHSHSCPKGPPAMPIENRNPATSRYATGYITPYFRLATHLGYVCGVASDTDKPWDARRSDIRNDLAEAIDHLRTLDPIELYISPATIDLLAQVQSDILQIQENPQEDTITTDLQNCCHNLTAAIAKVEYDTTGSMATAGTET